MFPDISKLKIIINEKLPKTLKCLMSCLCSIDRVERVQEGRRVAVRYVNKIGTIL